MDQTSLDEGCAERGEPVPLSVAIAEPSCFVPGAVPREPGFTG